MCPFFVYFKSSLEESSDDVEQIDPPTDDTKKTKKKKEPKVVCVHVHPGAIATLPPIAFSTHCDTVQAEQSVPAPKKKFLRIMHAPFIGNSILYHPLLLGLFLIVLS